jgi:hypothetical protein
MDQTHYCPVPSRSLLLQRLRTGKYALSPAVGLELQCARCGEYWPADTEFYYAARSAPGGLHSYCRACYREHRYTSREVA